MDCNICHLNPPKYTCPACQTKSCSLECVRRHKKQNDCTGQADSTQFVPRDELKVSHVNRDYNFLMRMNRNISLGKDDIRSDAKNVFRRSRLEGPAKRPRLEDPRIALVNAAFGSPHTSIKRENTLVVHLPVGMSRATSNKSGYDKKAGLFVWTIEWVVLDGKQEVARFLSYRLKEKLVWKDCVPLNVLKNSFGDVDKDSLHFYLANVCSPGHMMALSSESTICEGVADKIVLEYPTVYVSREEVDESLIKGYGKEEDSESDSDDSDDSDDSSDESDSSDEEPEEESSKEKETKKESEMEESMNTKSIENAGMENKDGLENAEMETKKGLENAEMETKKWPENEEMETKKGLDIVTNEQVDMGHEGSAHITEKNPTESKDSSESTERPGSYSSQVVNEDEIKDLDME